MAVENKSVMLQLKEFMENEAHSCSMDFGCVTPEYVYRMWGGMVSLEEIVKAWPKDSRIVCPKMNCGARTMRRFGHS